MFCNVYSQILFCVVSHTGDVWFNFCFDCVSIVRKTFYAAVHAQGKTARPCLSAASTVDQCQYFHRHPSGRHCVCLCCAWNCCYLCLPIDGKFSDLNLRAKNKISNSKMFIIFRLGGIFTNQEYIKAIFFVWHDYLLYRLSLKKMKAIVFTYCCFIVPFARIVAIYFQKLKQSIIKQPKWLEFSGITAL